MNRRCNEMLLYVLVYATFHIAFALGIGQLPTALIRNHGFRGPARGRQQVEEGAQYGAAGLTQPSLESV